MKLSSNPAMWGNLKSINALMTKDSVRHKKSHVTEKFSMKDVKAAISMVRNICFVFSSRSLKTRGEKTRDSNKGVATAQDVS